VLRYVAVLVSVNLLTATGYVMYQQV